MLLGIGMVLVKTWVFLRWVFARFLGPGPERVDPSRFHLHRFARLLVRAIEDVYGVVFVIPTHIDPRPVIY